MYPVQSMYTMGNQFNFDFCSPTLCPQSNHQLVKFHSPTTNNHNYHNKRTYKGDKPYRCDVCRKGFCRRINLSNHEQSTTAEKHFYCMYCHKAFSQRAHLKTHEITHTGLKPYTCEFCSKMFAQRANFDNHRRTHTGERPYCCSWCPKAFAQLTNLNNHLRIHTSEKPFVCSMCLKAFSQVTNLRNHERIHTGEKPFVCVFCSKAFSQLTHLHNHERVHTGEKPYGCPTCSKTFSQRANLDNHKRIHTGERPFTCSVCKKSFSQVTNLRNHERIHAAKAVSAGSSGVLENTREQNRSKITSNLQHGTTLFTGVNCRKPYYLMPSHHYLNTLSHSSQNQSHPGQLQNQNQSPVRSPFNELLRNPQLHHHPPSFPHSQYQTAPQPPPPSPPPPLPSLPPTSTTNLQPQPLSIPTWMTPSCMQPIPPNWDNSYTWPQRFPMTPSCWNSNGSKCPPCYPKENLNKYKTI